MTVSFIFGLKAQELYINPATNRFVVAQERAHYQFNYIHIPQSDLISWKLIASADKQACGVFFLHPLSMAHYALQHDAFIPFVSGKPNLLDVAWLEASPLTQ